MNEEARNPKLVLDAITDSGVQFTKFTLKPLTISKYAWLEKLDSPFINSEKKFSFEEVVPTVYVLATDAKDLRKYAGKLEELNLDALEWADEHIDIAEFPEVIKAVVTMFTSLNKAAPSDVGGADDKKKA